MEASQAADTVSPQIFDYFAEHYCNKRTYLWVSAAGVDRP